MMIDMIVCLSSFIMYNTDKIGKIKMSSILFKWAEDHYILRHRLIKVYHKSLNDHKIKNIFLLNSMTSD